MDAIGAVTAITVGVMRRIADAIDNQTADGPQEVHYHFHISQADKLDSPDIKPPRLFGRR